MYGKCGTHDHEIACDRPVRVFTQDPRKHTLRQDRSAIPASAYGCFAVGSPRNADDRSWPIADAVRIVAVITEPAPVKRILKLLGEPPRWLPIPMHAGHSFGTILRSRHRTGNSSASPRPTSSSTSALPGSGRLLSGAAQPRLCSVCLRSHQNRSPALGKRTSVAAGHGERSEGAESG